MEFATVCLTVVGLAIGGQHFVLGASAIGRHWGMSPILVGATIVALGTSLPELGVSVLAALQGYTDISVGNVVGSNVFNICIILGIAALIYPMTVERVWLVRDGMVMLVATAGLLLVCLDGRIGRIDGMLLLVVGLAAITMLVVTGSGNPESGKPFRWWDLLRVVVALGLILVSSHFLVESAVAIASQFGVSEWVIGITIVAQGTSLPELATTVAAVVQKRPGLVIGNLLGSNTMNILLVLGSAASFLELNTGNFSLLGAVTFAGLMLLSFVFLCTNRNVTRVEGAVLLSSGIAWCVWQAIMG